MTSQSINFIRAILQGMTGVGLFRGIHYPGETEEYIGTETAEEVRSSLAYQHLLSVARRAPSVRERETAAYYEDLYCADTEERIQERPCAATR